MIWEGHIKRRDVVWLNIKLFWLKLQKLGRIKNSKMWTINIWVAMFHVSLYLWQWQLSRRALKAHWRLIAVSFVTLSFNEIKSEIHKLNFYGCSFSNLGNTCYMNAILQSLLGLPPFVQDLSNRALLENVFPHCLYK